MERFAIVLSRGCCGGFHAGTVVKVTDETMEDAGRTISRCLPIRNSQYTTDMWHCDSCLMFISKEEAYGTVKGN